MSFDVSVTSVSMASSEQVKATGNGGEELPDRPGTAMSLSDQTGMGEDSMMSFFRSYMTSILQPFAENVEELHKVVTNNAQNVNDLGGRIDSTLLTFDEFRETIAGVRADLDPVIPRVDATQALLDTTIADKASLQGDFEASKMKISELEVRMAEAQTSIEELQKSLKDTRCRVGKCVDEQAKTDRELLRMQANTERLPSEIAALSSAHENTSQSLSSAKVSLQNSIEHLQANSKARAKDHKDLQTKLEESMDSIESRFRPLDERHEEVKRHLQSHQDMHKIHDAAVEALQERLKAHDGGHEEHRDKINKIDVALTDHNVRAVETGENVRKVIQIMEEAAQETRDSISGVVNQILDLASSIKQLQERVHIVIDKNDEKDFIQLLQEDMELASARCERLDKLMGLEPLTKENLNEEAGVVFVGGVMLTSEQLAEFKQQFKDLDKDGSGNIGKNDIVELLKSLGHEDPPMDIIDEILADLDTDNSGEVSCDEFCVLMAKMSGPDGKVDVDKMYRRKSEGKSLEAAQRELFSMVPQHAERIHEHKVIIDKEQTKLIQTDQRVHSIEKDYLELLNEVRKLREGLDLNQEYWKGLSRGLKETKKNVHKEGEGEMLPSATRLRNALPPLTARPATAGNLSTAL